MSSCVTLRLLETFPADDVHAAVRDAVRQRVRPDYDAVKHLLLCRIEGTAAEDSNSSSIRTCRV